MHIILYVPGRRTRVVVSYGEGLYRDMNTSLLIIAGQRMPALTLTCDNPCNLTCLAFSCMCAALVSVAPAVAAVMAYLRLAH